MMTIFIYYYLLLIFAGITVNKFLLFFEENKTHKQISYIMIRWLLVIIVIVVAVIIYMNVILALRNCWGNNNDNFIGNIIVAVVFVLHNINCIILFLLHTFFLFFLFI